MNSTLLLPHPDSPSFFLTAIACHCSVVLVLLFVGLQARTVNQHRALRETLKKGVGPDLGHRRGTSKIVPEQQKTYHA